MTELALLITSLISIEIVDFDKHAYQINAENKKTHHTGTT